ncbi:hypothetical protein [Planktomarina sp.]|uniref:hypothetical protein n=1 Tax=Planktomarina sp. TaxID=2024851 RepID=UPI003261A9D7
MQDIIGQVARGSDTKRAPNTPAGMMTAFDQVLDVPLEDRVSQTLSWLADWRGWPPVDRDATRRRAQS